MSTVTVNVTSGNGDEGSFPFAGEWESFGAGFSQDSGDGFIFNIGSVDSQSVGGNQLQIAGVVTGSGYGTPPSPAVIIAFLGGGIAQTAFNQVTIITACTTVVLLASDAVFNPNIPSSGAPESSITTWAWSGIEDPYASVLFTNDIITTLVFDFPSPLPTMNLSAEVISQTQIDLSWTDSSSPTPQASNYNVSRDGEVIAHLSNTVFSYNDTGLTADTTYSYEVTGVT
jgi:hypothetical protein